MYIILVAWDFEIGMKTQFFSVNRLDIEKDWFEKCVNREGGTPTPLALLLYLKNMLPLHITKCWEVTTFYVSPINSANFPIYIPQYRMKQRSVQLFASSLNSHKFFFLWFLRYIDPMLYFCSISAHLSWNLKWACLIAFCSSSVCQSIRPLIWM